MIPSKKVFALILLSIALVTSVFLLAESKNSPKEYVSTPEPVIIASAIDTTKDSDMDGLKDWEEALWGTDPNVADSEKLNTKASSTKVSAPLTATDKLARSFFSQYMNLKQVGLQNDKESQEQVTQTLVDINIADISPKIYTIDSIKTASIYPQEYVSAVDVIIKRNTLATRSEIEIFREAVTTENQTMMEELVRASKGYKDMVKQLLDLHVPQTAKEAHLRLVNTMSKMSFVIDSFSKAFSDPVSAVQGLSIFQDTFDSMVASFIEVKNLNRNETNI